MIKVDRNFNSNAFGLSGLTSDQVIKQRELDGPNKGIKSENPVLHIILSVATEPMFLLLLAACLVYFILNAFSEAFTMLAALLFVSGIDVFQNFRSQKAVNALSKINEHKTQVLRNGNATKIPVEEVVTKDILICEEGTIIPADAEIISSNDFAVNESILTGEYVSVEKFQGEQVMQGTLVVRGYCYAVVTSVGTETTLSGISKLVATTGKEKTPLQLKVAKFVRVMVIAGGLAFAFVWGYYWWESGSIFHGLLHGLTMAMSVLPEEIPVALSTFMALGAYRLMQQGVIARNPRTVETLGSATVICLDKTGTLTKNLMTVTHTYDVARKKEINFEKGGEANDILEYAMWASEENPFDPMEKSIHTKYAQYFRDDLRKTYHMVKEFPLSGSPPVMTHIFQNLEGDTIIGCKGGLESILRLCSVTDDQKNEALMKAEKYAKEGLRVLGLAKGRWNNKEMPVLQDDIPFTFLGIITFFDPPDPHVSEAIEGFYKAGVDVKMITGDYRETAVAIARLNHIRTDKILTGNEIAELNDDALDKKVSSTHIFARVSPETKLRIIDALKRAGEIVAMTGDGVNDAPALKSAHIGIAMGKRGTEVAKGAAGLVLSSDDLSKMIQAIFLGRRINENLTKAIRYIISIHIPIILLVTLPIFIPWLPATLFTPIHVIFLELIMGPTCSIIYENEPTPMEDLKHPTHAVGSTLISSSKLFVTIIQGLMITLGCVIAGYYAVDGGFAEEKIRAYVFTTLIISNIFLTLINRSFKRTIFATIKIKNKFIPIIILMSVVLLVLIIYLPVAGNLFSVSRLEPVEFLIPLTIAFLSTFWIEVFKFLKHRDQQKTFL
jgi:P-type Ca2+ transporter type 2C